MPTLLQPTKEREADMFAMVHLFNMSDEPFQDTYNGEVYILPPKCKRPMAARAVWCWLGDATVRKEDTPEDWELWAREVVRIRNRRLHGSENRPEEGFFGKYLLTGKLFALEIYQDYIEKTGFKIDESLSFSENMARVAKAYYGRLGGQGRKESVIGIPITEADLNLKALSAQGSISEVTDDEVLAILSGNVGSHVKTATPGGPGMSETEAAMAASVVGNIRL